MIVAKRNWRWALAATLLTSAVAVAGIAFWPFGGGASEEKGGSPVAAETDGVGEGIQVHGDWVIEVRNADGSVAERREFENALNATGSHYLTRLLDRSASMGAWAITLYGNPGPCADTSPSDYCIIRETNGGALTGLTGTHFTPLSVSNSQNPNELIVQGNFDAPHDGDIQVVQTWACISLPPNLDPGQCNNAGGTFTSTTLGIPVNVLTGQQVLVTVRISFS